ncbi:hypothetical protein NAT51_16130 [Flavobacterium amniphilum]|uniref:DUF6600 domain-containing protein n=1 Tax=Flavobacterium amniphilum TaxID=1834035 RepID=UPI00202AB636|nr:DUF6600 domain-containing protein [Flavobacterium amniphilum]MCL9807064.1 hypothetical protein [Flavobacterium amniphilum]
MKTIRNITVLLLLSIGIAGLTPQKAMAQTSVSFQLFYDNLSVYGNWIDNPNYGYVWAPNVGAGFAPYRTNGYWAYTDMGWTWVSNYPWGWAPFHYGRWFYDPHYGWLWMPDNQWGPAWVTWRYYDGYYGWAAIGPGISIDIAFSSGYHVPYNHWVFVKERDFCRRNISNYYVSSSSYNTIISKSKVINNTRVNNGVRYGAGPGREHVQKRVGTGINQTRIRGMDKPGQRVTQTEMQLYKPHVKREANRNAAPSKVMNRKETANMREARPATRPNVNKEQRTQPVRQREIQRDMQRENPREHPQRNKPDKQRAGQREREPQMQNRMERPTPMQQDMDRSRNDRPPMMESQTRRQEMPQQNNRGLRPVKQKTGRILNQEHHGK